MKFKLFFSISLLFAFAVLFQSFSVPADQNNISSTEATYSEDDSWVRLGTTTVKNGLDRDVIMVTAGRGIFKKMKLKVKGAPIEMEKLVVHYGNGDVQSVAMRKNIAAGSESRLIDLVGNHRVIKKVVFWYSKKHWGDHTPVVTAWGRR